MSNISIFDVLKRVDVRDFDYFASLTVEEQKKISTYMLLRLMGFSNSPEKLRMLNTIPNKIMFRLSNNPKLLYHILAVCGSGKEEFYKIKKPIAKITTKPKSLNVIVEYYNVSKIEATGLLSLSSFDDVKLMAEDLGKHDIIKTIKKEFKSDV